MARRRGILALLALAPVAVVAVGMQVAALTGAVAVAQLGWGIGARSAPAVSSGTSTLQKAARVLELTWASPAARVLEWNPLTLGAVDDIRHATHAAAEAATMLDPAAGVGTTVLGLDGRPPMLAGSSVDLTRLDELAEPTARLATVVSATDAALGRVEGSGPLGAPIGAVASSLRGATSDLAVLAEAAVAALPALPEALGSTEPKRYLVCALNDAELFASGGAPLSALLVEAVQGTVSVPLSGQLESKLSPNNPPITWRHAGGPPWYRPARKYPFVNSDFHPDFRTAGVDMRRAWAALGYPEVDGVITVDVNALASILDWAGPVQAEGYGRVSGSSIIRQILVDAYREFDSAEGVLERHARNDALVEALADHLSSPPSLLPALRGVMDAIPPRHVQLSFRDPRLRRAAEALGADGALASGSGDLVAAFSQSGPNKLSVFQERAITQDVRLAADGGAAVRRVVAFTNAVPEGVEGVEDEYRGYLALRARMRVAHRVPEAATDVRITVLDSDPLVAQGRTGPFLDDRGGLVMWQGHDTAPRETSTILLEYQLPAGTFAPGTYSVSADPQALTLPTTLRVRVFAAAGSTLPDTEGWTRAGDSLIWSGQLDRPLRLAVG